MIGVIFALLSMLAHQMALLFVRQAENEKGDLGELLRKFAAGMKVSR